MINTKVSMSEKLSKSKPASILQLLLARLRNSATVPQEGLHSTYCMYWCTVSTAMHCYIHAHHVTR